MNILELTLALQAKAEEILSTITTSGGGNPVDTDYSWSGNIKVADYTTWFEIVHPEHGSEWLNGEMVEADGGVYEHLTKEF